MSGVNGTGNIGKSSAPPPKQKAAAAETPAAVTAPKVEGDALALSGAPAPDGPPQYFGHRPEIKLSLFLKQPIWADDRSDVTGEQWAQMPQSQRDQILALIPTPEARAQFLSSVDPKVMQAKKELGEAVSRGWSRALEWAERRQAEQAQRGGPATPPSTDAQVDRLNALVEQADKK